MAAVYVVLLAALLVVAQAVNSETDLQSSWTHDSDSSRCAASYQTFKVGDTPVSIYRGSSPSGKNPTPMTKIPLKSNNGRKPISLVLSAAVPWCPICPKGKIIVLRASTGPATHDIIRTSPTTPDHQQRTWYDVWEDFWISLAILTLHMFWPFLENGVIVCVLVFLGGMIWNIAGRIQAPWLVDTMSFFLLAMFVVSYWYIIKLLGSRGYMLEVQLSQSDRFTARMFLAF